MQDAEDVRRPGQPRSTWLGWPSGRCNAYFEAGVQAWDVAAGVLLVREAGGRVCDFRGAATGPMHVAGAAAGRQLIAGNLKVSEALQKAIVASGYAKAFG